MFFTSSSYSEIQEGVVPRAAGALARVHFQPLGRALDRNTKLNFIAIGPRIISESPEKENINNVDISGLRVALELRSGQSGKFLSSVDTL